MQDLFLFILLMVYFLSGTFTYGQKVNGLVTTKEGILHEGIVKLKLKHLKVKTADSGGFIKIPAEAVEDVFIFYEDEIIRYQYVPVSFYGGQWLMYFADLNGKKIYRHVKLYKTGKNKLHEKWYYFGLEEGAKMATWLHVSNNQDIFFKNNLLHFFGDKPEVKSLILEGYLSAENILEIIRLYQSEVSSMAVMEGVNREE
ncbi:hypothetical protein [Cecembia lonarensis]|nr:hypothetical protein [Cecembia lonarensis]